MIVTLPIQPGRRCQMGQQDPADAPNGPTDPLRAHVAQTTHDLANVLGAVLNYATFLAEDLENIEAAAEARSYVPHLERATERAIELVNQLAEEANPSARAP